MGWAGACEPRACGGSCGGGVFAGDNLPGEGHAGAGEEAGAAEDVQSKGADLVFKEEGEGGNVVPRRGIGRGIHEINGLDGMGGMAGAVEAGGGDGI